MGEIVGGRISPGESLPREADLVEQHGVSRGVVRECLRGLEERGLVNVKHGVGATVTPSNEWRIFDRDLLTVLLHTDRSAEVLGEYLEARRILEIEAAGLAAERATADDLTALSDAFATMTDTAERARANPAAERLYQEADIAFHRAVVLATGNRALSQMTESIHHALGAAVPVLARPDTRFRRALPEHKRILAAIVASDRDAAQDAMRAHLRTVEGNLRDYARAQAKRSRGRR
ncbi:MAG: FadR family transcriptional regulator [Solirubrobacterales bacterium]|nr:FadR family transcriptional regulator [Solirubrobacterales bacterium]